MNILMISDYPESSLFGQITSLKKTIQEFDKNVDLLTLSGKGLLLNGKIMKEGIGAHVHFLETILRRKS